MPDIFLSALADFSFGRVNSYLIYHIAAAIIIMVVWPLVDSFWSIAIYYAILGVILGGQVTMVPLVLAEFWGAEKLVTFFGLLSFCQSFSTFISGPISGAILDASTDPISKSIDWAPLIIYTSLTFGSGVFGILIVRFRKQRKIFTRI